MKRIIILGAALLSCAPSASSATAAYYVTGGNRTSGFKVASSGSLAVTGTLIARDLTIEAPSVGEIPAFTLDRTTVVLTPSNDADATMFYGTGALADNGNITLNSANDRLVLEKGTTTGTITVSESATIEGFGYFGGAISVADTKTLTFAVPSLNVNVTGLGTLLLETDVVCSDDVTTLPSTVNFNGYSMTYGTSQSDITLAGDSTLSDGSVKLAGNVTFGGTKTVGTNLTIDGNGNVLTMGSGVLAVGTGSLYLNDIALGDVATGSITCASNGYVKMANTRIHDNALNTVMTVLGSGNASTHVAASVSPASTGNMGAMWSTNLVWNNGALIELHTPATLGASGNTRTWTMSDNSEINANGNVLDLTYGTIEIAAGKTVTISNAIITGIHQSIATDDAYATWNTSFKFADSNATLVLNNCVVVVGSNQTLGGSVSISSTSTPIYTKIQMNGVDTFVTNSNVLTFDTNASLTINSGATAYYDPQGTGDNLNVTTANSGSISGYLVTLVNRDSRDIVISANRSLSDSKFLYTDETNVNGSKVQFTGDYTLDGAGRSLIFANTAETANTAMVILDANADAVMKNILLDGFTYDSIQWGSSSTLKFKNGTVIKLRRDDTVGSNNLSFVAAENSDSFTIDLGGQTLDLGSGALAVTAADTLTGVTLTIKNGTLKNVKTSSFSVATNNLVKIVLQDVDVVLSDALSSTLINWEFSGNCSISATGTSYPTWTQARTTSSSFKINSGAHLTVKNGMTLAFSSAAHANAVNLVDRSSVLELIGGTLSSSLSSSLVLTKGNLVADHASTLSGNITLGGATTDALYIDIMPAAQVNVSGGVLTYANSDSAS